MKPDQWGEVPSRQPASNFFLCNQLRNRSRTLKIEPTHVDIEYLAASFGVSTKIKNRNSSFAQLASLCPHAIHVQ